MDKQKALKELADLVERGKGFEEEGNYEYSKRCYAKVIIILKQLRIQSGQDQNQLELYKQKIMKYSEAVKRVQNLENQKANLGKRKSKLQFQFPQQSKIGQLQRNQIPLVKPQNNIENQNQRRTQGNQQKNSNDIKKNGQIDPDIQEMIVRDIKLSFKDIVGMSQVKEIIQDAVIKPRRRPDLFKGIRAPPKGILFYGPPGNGKTYIAKALAYQSKCTFFAVSASSIMNKWVGQAEKKLGKLFKTAQAMSPSIIFIDEIDSLLTARSEKENQVSRRVKTQFLILMDGVMSAKQGDVLLIGATNLPTQLDLAALRRFNKLIYIGLPDPIARQGMIEQNLKGVKYNLSSSDLKKITEALEGYSASQIKDIAKDAAMLPIRQIAKSQFEQINEDKIRTVNLKDFLNVISKRKPLLSKEDLKQYQAKYN